jgi:hypothetical protein
MPYFVYCKRCNPDGCYTCVDKKCGKCCGTGNDWREDKELATVHHSAGISLEKLRLEKRVTSTEGTCFIYQDVIPEIKEEQAQVISFKMEDDTSELDNQIARQDFKARLQLFINNFYLDDNNLNAYSETFKGEIDRVSLYISYVGVDQVQLGLFNAHLLKAEKLFDEMPELSCEQLLDIDPSAIQLFELQELMAHEHYHFLQFLTCGSVNTFFRATRRHNIIRAHVLSEAVRCGVQLDLNKDSEDKSIFDLILKFDDQSIQHHFFDVIKNARVETKVVSNFYNYKGSKSDFTIFDIFEGSAVAFQKLVNHTTDIATTFDKVEKGDSTYKRYFGAWDYFCDQGGRDKIIFFVNTYQSLKYGLLDDGDYMNVVPTPQDIFIVLCQNTAKYENLLKPDRFGSLSIPFVEDPLLRQFKLSAEQIDIIYKLVKIFDLMKEDIRAYSKQTNTYYQDDIFDRKITYDDNFIWSSLKKINEQVVIDHPIVDSEFFWPLLLVNKEFCNTFMFEYLPKVLKITQFKGIFGEATDIVNDNLMLKLVDDLDRYIRTGFTYCCDKHSKGIVDRLDIDCKSPQSFKNRYFKMTGNDLHSLFNY